MNNIFVIRFFHSSNKLIVGNKTYTATCDVRNEINGKRKQSQIVKTYPSSGSERKPYYPRKFPTGVWLIKQPIWTDDIDYAPVKIPTDAYTRVLTWETDRNGYKYLSGEHQTDSFYHLHYAKNSKTTLGCIRLNSDYEASEIAKIIETKLKSKIACFIEVLPSEE